jgi:hypothetical protein
MSRAAALALGALLLPALPPRPVAHAVVPPTSVAGVAAPADSTVYAGTQRWFVSDEPITFGGRRWVKFGMSRALTQSEAERVGEFRGVSVFRSAADRDAQVIYVAVRAGCDFQPYRREAEVRGVRG